MPTENIIDRMVDGRIRMLNSPDVQSSHHKRPRPRYRRQDRTEGYNVCISYVSDSKSAAHVVRDCEAAGRKAIAVIGNVANETDVSYLFVQCNQHLGSITLLVDKAGIDGKATNVRDLKDDFLITTSEVDVYGTVYCVREAIFRMAKSIGGTGGVIINVYSIAARLGCPDEYVHYAANKAAVETFTIGLTKEVGRDGIRVTALQASATDKDLHQRSGNPERPAMVASTAPIGRVATPRDIAEVILWLASPEVGYTNAVLPIAGGL